MVCGIKDHASLTSLRQHGLPRVRQRHPLPRVHAESQREARIVDRAGELGQTKLKHHVEDDVSRLRLEQRVTVGELAVSIGEDLDLLLATVPDPDRGDALGDLLAVGPDVLDWGRTRAARDPGERLDARPAFRNRLQDHVVPDLTGSDADHRCAGLGRLNEDPAGGDADY